MFRLRDARTHRVIERMERVLLRSADVLTDGCIVVVEDGRHRVRKLPIGWMRLSRGAGYFGKDRPKVLRRELLQPIASEKGERGRARSA